MTSKIVGVEFIKHRKRLLPAVLLSYLMATLALALYHAYNNPVSLSSSSNYSWGYSVQC